MNRTKRCIIIALVAMAARASLFAVDEQLATRFMNAANDQYTAGNYAKAFSYANTVLGLYKSETIPQNVEVLAETVCFAYLTKIKDERLFGELPAVKEKLIEYPFLSSERVTRVLAVISAYGAQGDSGGGPGSGNASRRSDADVLRELDAARKDAAADARRASDELLGTQKDAYETALKEANAANGAGARAIAMAILLLAGVCFIVFVIVIVNLAVNVRNQKSQNDKFVETLKAVSELARVPAATPMYEALPNLYGAGPEVRLIGSAMKETGLPPPPATEAEKAELSALAVKCRDIGVQIDQATGRKNNSKNVAELVFKVSQEMGAPQYESTLFFSVAMVYDIGFLAIDRELLLSESLNEDQKYEIRNHVKQGLAQLSFVPERYMAPFADGVLMHHENMDGSGYPEGLSGARIPYIARLIRVAESFNALISKRNYRDIVDKESAIEELLNKPGLYDKEIVETLERLI